MKQRFGKNRHIPLLLGLGVGIIGILPAYFALDLLVRYYDRFDRDSSLFPLILICSTIALSFFLLGFWVYQKSGRLGLEIQVRPGQVEFASTMIFGGNKNYIINWNEVRQVVMTDIPRAGETLYFHAYKSEEPWHNKGLPLKLNESRSGDVFLMFKESAAEVGLELYRTKRLITFFYDRYVWEVRQMTVDQT